jgi:ligand-binding SRPBCC domain-containing protein
MLHFNYSSVIDASVETVWQFHERPDILDILTSPWQPFQVIRREGGLGVGAITEFRLWFGPIPLRWLALHIACEPYRLFVDRQTEGPLDSWEHQHIFTPENGKTRLTDAIAFSLPGGVLVEHLIGWLVLAQLNSMFRYRHEVTQRECTKQS